MQNEKQNNELKQLDSVAELVEIASHLAASTVVVPGGDRAEDLHLVDSARDHGIVDRAILIGNRDKILAAANETGIEIDQKDIIAADNDEEIASATVQVVKASQANIVLKGDISTPVINRHMVKLAILPTISLVTIVDAAPVANGRPMIITDAGFTTRCNFGRMVNIVQNAIDVAHRVMGIKKPRVAILSANEKQIPSLPSTCTGLKLAQRNWSDAVVCGPLSFDLATAPGSVALKGLPDLPAAGEVAGQADILVCPGIDAANILYKTYTAMNKYGIASLAGITVGLPVPYVILSRADTVETKLNSIALCSIYSQRNKNLKPKSGIKKVGVSPHYHILVVNPGSTSLKLALFENDSCIRAIESECRINVYGTLAEKDQQVKLLAQKICNELGDKDLKNLTAISARGGFLPRPSEKLQGGVYVVAERIGHEIVVHRDIVCGVLEYPERDHASNLGIPVAAVLAEQLQIPAFSVDPVGVDEFEKIAEISGYQRIIRRSTSHALSIRAAAAKAADSIGRPLEEMGLVVAHLGGGITVAAVKKGRMIDNNIALLGEGPFSPERAGQLPQGELIDLCYSGQFTKDQLIKELTKNAGLMSYLGENRMEIIEKRIESGDTFARGIVDAMIYQIAKEIGSAVVAAGGDVEAVVLTGGLTRNRRIRDLLRRKIGMLAPVIIFEGSLEMEALACGAISVLSGREKPQYFQLPVKTYHLVGDIQHE